MQLGVVRYVREVEIGVRQALRTADSVLATARRSAAEQGTAVVAALDDVRAELRAARAAIAAGEQLSEVTYRFQRRVDEAARSVVSADVESLSADLAAIATLSSQSSGDAGLAVIDDAALDRLAHRDWSPLGALESVRAVVRAVDVDRADEAQSVMPLATISVTEDMATSMRLHSLGWRTVYHHEILARGLAPEDLGSMLHQRLRWAQGTLQVMLRENPLVQRGLSWGQRLMYFATMWTYLSGFAAVVYIAAPVLYLCFGVQPVESFGTDFMARFIPYFIANQLLFLVVGYGVRTWRGQQYSLALFPLWIRACATAVGNVLFGRELGFVVTSKTRQEGGPPWRLIRPQLIAMAVLVGAAVVGVVRLALGAAPSAWGTGVNLAWVAYDILMISVVVQAARYKGSDHIEEGIA